MANELPKTERPYRNVKGTTRKASYVLRMIDERAREGARPGVGGGYVLWQSKKATKPTLSLGWYLPNNFEADWKGLRVCFRVEQFKEGKLSRWGIASYSVQSLKQGKPLGKVEHLPLHTFLEEAIHLATVQGITYPPGYEGAVVGLDGNSVPGWVGAVTKVPESATFGETLVIDWLSETPRDILRDFVATETNSSKQKKLSHEKRLKLVAKAWKEAPNRGKNEAVYQALKEALEQVGRDRVKQLIQEAREKGLIPPSTRSKK